jgi:putative transposase
VSWAIKDKGYTQRRACGLVGQEPKTYRYASKRPDDDGLRQRLKELALERRRFGYRRLHILLRREGIVLNHKKLYRLYREERLMVRKRGGRKRALGTRAPMAIPQGPNQRWSLDFVSDALASSRKFRVLTVVDDFSRECVALVVDNSLSGVRVARELDRICAETGYPSTIRVDQGSEFVSRDLDLWAYTHGVTLDFSRPGKPTDNAFIEAFNSKLRAECLNAHWFMSLEDARQKLEDWRRYYNEDRPHSGIGQIPPILLHNPGGVSGPPLGIEAENSGFG